MEVTLPYSGAVVELYVRQNYDDLIRLRNRKEGEEIEHIILDIYIHKWDFIDEKGKMLAKSKEVYGLLDREDVMFLVDKINEITRQTTKDTVKRKTEEKKDDATSLDS